MGWSVGWTVGVSGVDRRDHSPQGQKGSVGWPEGVTGWPEGVTAHRAHRGQAPHAALTVQVPHLPHPADHGVRSHHEAQPGWGGVTAKMDITDHPPPDPRPRGSWGRPAGGLGLVLERSLTGVVPTVALSGRRLPQLLHQPVRGLLELLRGVPALGQREQHLVSHHDAAGPAGRGHGVTEGSGGHPKTTHPPISLGEPLT